MVGLLVIEVFNSTFNTRRLYRVMQYSLGLGRLLCHLARKLIGPIL